MNKSVLFSANTWNYHIYRFDDDLSVERKSLVLSIWFIGAQTTESNCRVPRQHKRRTRWNNRKIVTVVKVFILVSCRCPSSLLMLQGPWSSVQRSATWIISLLGFFFRISRWTWLFTSFRVQSTKEVLGMSNETLRDTYSTHACMWFSEIPHILKKDMLRKTKRSN